MEEIAINIYQIDEMCRLCLTTGVTLLDIFQSSTRTKDRVADVIMHCAPVKINKCDEMPKFICRTCYTQLEKNHQFQTQIVQSEKTLRRYLQQLHASDKQIKTECSEDPLSSTGNSYDTVETVTKNDDCEISSEDTKNDFGNSKLTEDIDVNLKEKEHANFISENKVKEETTFNFGIKDELIMDDNSLISSECADDSFVTFPKIYVSEIGYEDQKIDINRTSGNFERSCSADVTEDFDKREEGNKTTSVNNVVYKEASKMKYKCDFCNECFIYQSIFERHRRSHTGEKPYECDVCNKCFARLSTLNIHKRIHSGEKPHQCHVCNKHFTQLAHLNTHKRTHIGEKPCDDIAEDFEKRKEGVKNVSTNDETWGNAKKIEYKCDICSKCFLSQSSLIRHKLIHTGEKPYQCDICNKEFYELSNLNRHKLAHTGDKPYMCDMCSMCFNNSDHLKRHKRTHTGEKPYRCEICNRAYPYLHGLKRHILTHTGEKLYQCDVCMKHFYELSDLRRHKLTHTDEKPYKCDVCNKCFSQISQLYMHKHTHTGERPYPCDVCNKSFAKTSRLRIHKRIHTGEKPYRCDVCNMCFTYSYNLNQHMTTHS